MVETAVRTRFPSYVLLKTRKFDTSIRRKTTLFLPPGRETVMNIEVRNVVFPK